MPPPALCHLLCSAASSDALFEMPPKLAGAPLARDNADGMMSEPEGESQRQGFNGLEACHCIDKDSALAEPI